TPQRPSVPTVVRGPFALAALAVISSWSVGGLFLSLGPQLSATLFHTNDHLVAGLSVFALAGSGAAAQLLFGRTAVARRRRRLGRAVDGPAAHRPRGGDGVERRLHRRRRDRRSG